GRPAPAADPRNRDRAARRRGADRDARARHLRPHPRRGGTHLGAVRRLAADRGGLTAGRDPPLAGRAGRHRPSHPGTGVVQLVTLSRAARTCSSNYGRARRDWGWSCTTSTWRSLVPDRPGWRSAASWRWPACAAGSWNDGPRSPTSPGRSPYTP